MKDFKDLPTAEQVKAIIENPALAKDYDWSKLTGSDWSRLLHAKPQFAVSDWSLLTGFDWMWLLRKQPQFAEHYVWTKLNGYAWSFLLQVQPQFAEYCDWSKLDGWNWTHLLQVQPQLSIHCDWSKLNGNGWSLLLQKQPQFVTERREDALSGTHKLGRGLTSSTVQFDESPFCKTHTPTPLHSNP